jgi:leader peptidase (prepilin peptidase)/N-methyltransferase
MSMETLPPTAPAFTIGADREKKVLALLVAAYALAWTAALGFAPEAATLRLLLSGALGVTLVTLSIIDLTSLRLPDRLTLPLLGFGLIAAIVELGPQPAAFHGLAAALGYGTLVLVEHHYRRIRGRDGLGRGDAKLLAASGAWVGIEGLAPVLVIASLGMLAAIGIASLLTHRPLADLRLPLGPALAAATWLVWHWGPFL